MGAISPKTFGHFSFNFCQYFYTIWHSKSRGIGFYIGNHIVAVAPELKTFIGMGLILHDQHLRCPKWIICFSGLAGFGEYQKWHPITQFGRSGAHAMQYVHCDQIAGSESKLIDSVLSQQSALLSAKNLFSKINV